MSVPTDNKCLKKGRFVNLSGSVHHVVLLNVECGKSNVDMFYVDKKNKEIKNGKK